MSLNNIVTLDEIIELMNELLEIDSQAITELIQKRVVCNEKLANHPTVQVSYDKKYDNYKVGLLGILNGLFGTDEDGYGAICINVQDGKILNFARTEDYDKY